MTKSGQFLPVATGRFMAMNMTVIILWPEYVKLMDLPFHRPLT
jgi:hypothetical protein